jgi:hypothetical protein
MHRTVIRLLLGLALLVGVAGAGPAQAGTTDITFNLTGTLITPFGVAGPPGTGTAVLTFPTASASYSHALSGAVHAQALNFAQSIFLLGGGLVGNVALAGGSFTGNAVAGNMGLNAALHVTAGFLHCNLGVTPCGTALGLPFSSVVPITSQPFAGALNGFASVVSGVPGLANFNITGNIGTLGGQPITLQLTGTEVSRTHPTPEPGSLGLLAVGLAGGLLFGVRRLRG